MGLLAKLTGYEDSLREALETIKLRDERIARLLIERESLLAECHSLPNLRVGRLIQQIKRLGHTPVE